MDASTYLRRKKESMLQYIHKPAFVDAGTRTELLGRTAGSAYYVNPNTNTITGKLGFAGSAAATPVKVTAPGCCAIADTQSISIPCCEMIYEPASALPACKTQPYVGTPAQQKEAVALRICGRK